MTDLDDEPRELFQLHGEAVEFLLRYEFVAKASPDKRDLFTQMISADNAGSISEVIPDCLHVYANARAVSDLTDCFSWGGSGQFIVSDRMKTLLQAFMIPNLEFYNVRLTLRVADDVGTDRAWVDGDTLQRGFWLMYCFNREDLFDLEKSKVEWRKSFVGHRSPWFSRWKHLVLKSRAKHHLYGVEGNLPRRRFVSEGLRDAIRNEGIEARILAHRLNFGDRGYSSD